MFLKKLTAILLTGSAIKMFVTNLSTSMPNAGKCDGID